MRCVGTETQRNKESDMLGGGRTSAGGTAPPCCHWMCTSCLPALIHKWWKQWRSTSCRRTEEMAALKIFSLFCDLWQVFEMDLTRFLLFLSNTRQQLCLAQVKQALTAQANNYQWTFYSCTFGQTFVKNVYKGRDLRGSTYFFPFSVLNNLSLTFSVHFVMYARV